MKTKFAVLSLVHFASAALGSSATNVAMTRTQSLCLTPPSST